MIWTEYEPSVNTGAEGVVIICEALKGNTTLKHLNLSCQMKWNDKEKEENVGMLFGLNSKQCWKRGNKNYKWIVEKE